MPDSRTGRVDVHAHFIPPFYRDALIRAGQSRPDGMPAIPAWSTEEALKAMDALGIEFAMLSISSPGVHFGNDADSRTLASAVNEEGMRIKRQHPDRFGYLAAMPLPDVEGALAEAHHMLVQEGADGLIMETNHAGLYPGDPALDPLWTKLDLQDAKVLIHPTSPACSCSVRHDQMFPRPMMEFMFETARAVTDLVVAAVLERFPRISFIIPHAGAVLPVLASRVDMITRVLARDGKSVPRLRDAMHRLHFDLAGAPLPELLPALLCMADERRIHYGSDYPFTPLAVCQTLLGALLETPVLDEGQRRAMLGENARALFGLGGLASGNGI